MEKPKVVPVTATFALLGGPHFLVIYRSLKIQHLSCYNKKRTNTKIKSGTIV